MGDLLLWPCSLSQSGRWQIKNNTAVWMMCTWQISTLIILPSSLPALPPFFPPLSAFLSPPFFLPPSLPPFLNFLFSSFFASFPAFPPSLLHSLLSSFAHPPFFLTSLLPLVLSFPSCLFPSIFSLPHPLLLLFSFIYFTACRWRCTICRPWLQNGRSWWLPWYDLSHHARVLEQG